MCRPLTSTIGTSFRSCGLHKPGAFFVSFAVTVEKSRRESSHFHTRWMMWPCHSQYPFRYSHHFLFYAFHFMLAHYIRRESQEWVDEYISMQWRTRGWYVRASCRIEGEEVATCRWRRSISNPRRVKEWERKSRRQIYIFLSMKFS